MITKLSETLKAYGTSITTLFTIIATIGGAVLYVNNNYANAEDVKEVLRNQRAQISMQERSQKDNMMFRLEYYDDRLAKLQEEKRIAEERERTGTRNRAIQKTSKEISEEITELKIRRDLVRRSLVDADKLPTQVPSK
jgi:hypothetical protein